LKIILGIEDWFTTLGNTYQLELLGHGKKFGQRKELGIEVNSYNLFGEFHCNRVLYLTVERWVVLFSRVDQFLTELSKQSFCAVFTFFRLFFRDCYCYFCWFDCLIDLLYTSSYWCDIYELTTRSKFIFSIHKKLISINLFN
jgi:hypothetical protein